MPATFKANLKPEPNAEGMHSIRIRVIKDRVPRFYATGLFIAKSHWNPNGKYKNKNWVASKYHNYKEYNDVIEKDIDALKTIAQDNRSFTSDEIIAAYKQSHQPAAAQTPAPESGFINYCRTWITRKESLKQSGTASVYNTALKRLLEYTGETPNEKKLLTPKGAAAFLSWLLNAKKKKKPDQNRFEPSTVKQTIGLLNTFYTNALLEGWIPQAPNPFDDSTVIVPRKKKKRPSKSQVQSFMTLQLQGSKAHARNAFLLQFFINGARISEALMLKWEHVNKDHIEYLPKKRSPKLKIVKRHPGIDWILNQYENTGGFILPYLSEADMQLGPNEFLNRIKGITYTINLGLQAIGKQIGLSFKLSTHMSRHSFTDALLKETKDLRKVQEMLGHQSIRSTEVYTEDLSQEDLDETSVEVFKDFFAPEKS